jgi:hypothetical protein
MIYNALYITFSYLPITNSGFRFGLDFTHTKNSQYSVRVNCIQREFLISGHVHHNCDVILLLYHPDIIRILTAISVHFIIICHTAYLSELREFNIVDYDVWQLVRRKFLKDFQTIQLLNEISIIHWDWWLKCWMIKIIKLCCTVILVTICNKLLCIMEFMVYIKDEI